MILVINGSPNSNSKTLRVTNEIIRHFNEEIVFINAYKSKLDSCDDCKYCHTKIGCIKNDDMNEIYDLMFKSTSLIISSPVYFGAMTDKTMKIVNRFQRFYEQKFSLKDKNIPKFNNLLLVSTQGDINMDMFDGVIQTFKILDLLFNPGYSELITIPSTDKFDPLMQTKVIEQINRVQKKMIT